MEVKASKEEPEVMAFERQEEGPGFSLEQEGGPKEPEKGSEAMVLGGQDFNVEQGAMEREMEMDFKMRSLEKRPCRMGSSLRRRSRRASSLEKSSCRMGSALRRRFEMASSLGSSLLRSWREARFPLILKRCLTETHSGFGPGGSLVYNYVHLDTFFCLFCQNFGNMMCLNDS